MTGWEIDPGKWEISQGTQADASAGSDARMRARGLSISNAASRSGYHVSRLTRQR